MDAQFPQRLPAVSFPKPALIKRRVQHILRRRAEGGAWLDRVAAALGVQLHGKAQRISVSVRNQNWVVNTLQGKAILKRYRPSVDALQIAFEHGILNHLAGLGFPAPRLFAARDGNTCIALEEKNYALYHFLPGYTHFDEHIYLPDQKLPFLCSEAILLARLHDSLSGFCPPGRNPQGMIDTRTRERWWKLDFFTTRLENSIRHSRERLRQGNDSLLRKMLGLSEQMGLRLEALERELAAANLEVGVIHGDFGQYNLLVRRGCPLVVADFELARLDYRAIDVIAMLSSEVGSNTKPGDSSHARLSLLVDLYRETRATPVDLSALADLWEWLALRRLIVLWENYATSQEASAWRSRLRERLARLDWIGRERSFLKRIGAGKVN